MALFVNWLDYQGDGGDYAQFTLDPVANIRRKLPALPTHYAFWADDVPPTILIQVDYVARSFRVFLFVYTKQAGTEMYMYESSSGKWRRLASPPEEQGLAETSSVVVFHGILYIDFNTPHPNTLCCLLSYNLQEDVWRVLKVSIPRFSQQEAPDPHVVVSNNRSWMTRWYNTLEETWMEDDLYFEIARVRITANSMSVEIEAIMETPREMIGHQFGEPFNSKSFAYPFPSTPFNDLDDPWDPFIWMSDLSGKMKIIEYVNDWVDVLPTYPVGQWNEEEWQSDTSDEEDDSYTYYRARYMNLSMRNILSSGPVFIDPCV